MRALLIGIDCYMPNQLDGGGFYPHLQGCVNDVRRIREVLRRKVGLTDAGTTMLTASGQGTKPTETTPWPTYANIVSALKKLCGDASPGEQVYVHYSGHGGRASTIFPTVKGPTGLDEGLVPTDVGTGTYVRDLELASLFHAMVQKGIILTVAVDACHSGGLPRGKAAWKRGISKIDTTPRPAQSDVASLVDLMALYKPPPVARDASFQAGWLLRTTGYTLITACRASESAFETFFGSSISGALTNAMCESLEALRPDLTYDMLGDRLIALVHGNFDMQNPSVEGERDRVVFGTKVLEKVQTINVLSHDPAAGRARVAAGQAGGLRKGSTLMVYPNGTVDFDDVTNRIALLEVRDLSDTESDCEVKTRFIPGASPSPGDAAVLVGNTAIALQRGVSFVAEELDAARIEGIRKEIAAAGGGWLREVGSAEAADFKVGIGDDGCDEILDGSGTSLRFIQPRVKADPADLEKKADQLLVKRLVHLAKHRNIRSLANNDSQSRLANKLSMTLEGWQSDWDPVDGVGARHSVPFDSSARPAVPHEATVFLRIKNLLAPNPADINDPSRILNVVLFDLGPRWNAVQLWPNDGPFRSLQPGEETIVPLGMLVPAGAESCVDTLKAIGTTGASAFRWMQLPPLDGGLRGPLDPPTNPLEELFQALSEGAPSTRDVVPPVAVTQRWTTAQLDITTFRPPKQV
ncbi:MAG: caspase family protein [Polyangiaceae bacterium]